MTFSVRKVPANFTSLYDFDTWVVEKTLKGGERYLISTYDNESLANWCRDSIRVSLEVRNGAVVEP